MRMFNGGMLTDVREPVPNGFRYSVNFDTQTNPYKITPYHDSESGDSAASTSEKQNFCVAQRSGSQYNLYALGVQTGTSKPQVLMKTLTIGGSDDLSDNGWATPSNGAGSVGTSFNLFTFYKTAGRIVGANAAGTSLWSFDPTSANAWNDSYHSLTFTNIAEGLVHSMNDNLYIGYDNKITQNNAGTWTDAIWTLPDYLYVTALSEYGNYLAVLAAPLSGVGSSKVFLFNLANPGTTWDLMIDCGEGVGKVIAQLYGVLVTISFFTDVARNLSRIVFKEYTGSGMETFSTLQGSTFDSLLSKSQRVDERLLFQMALTQEGVQQAGVWSLSRNGNKFAIVEESTINNDTAILAGDIIGGFIKVSGFIFQAFTVSNAWALTKTNDQASYTATSILETSINPSMPEADKVQIKQLISAGLMYETMPAAGQAVLKYRVDSQNGAWTTIFTETTDGIVWTEPFARAISSGTSVEFTKGKEYEFMVWSTGGCEVTGILYKYQLLPSNA